ncbi:hypothetical protein HHI36_007776 [Cryptolaemus montrouzieri]|uniref:Uncharacterized protein n=1 Tax=Cryptolaemus montrouzieri TaxID=559131 RepID=A0ABD2MQS1_9CUCU
MDVPAGKIVCLSKALSKNEDMENEEICSDEMDIENIGNAEINSKENNPRLWLAVNNAAVRNAEKLILDENSSDDIDFDEIYVNHRKRTIVWKKLRGLILN